MTQEENASIFRAEALSHAQGARLGTLSVNIPIPIRAWLWFLGTITVAALTFSLWGAYVKQERVSGIITSDKGLVVVRSLAPGSVEQISVEEGHTVSSGQTLLVVYTDVGAATVSIEKGARQTRSGAAISNARERLDAIETEIKLVEAQVPLQEQRVAVARNRLARSQTLAEQGLLSQMELMNRQEELLQKRQALGDLRQRIAELRRGQVEIQGEESDAEYRTHVAIAAPVSGDVSSLPVAVGETISAGQSLLTLLPSSGHLVAEIYVPSRQVGLLHKGQAVHVAFDAFPRLTYGTTPGTIDDISRTPLEPGDLRINPGIREPVYRARVRLARSFVQFGDQQYPLQVGMTLQANIVIERRPLWRLIFDAPAPSGGKSG
jgi:membrane fusion protein